jgi:hypothetical protein
MPLPVAALVAASLSATSLAATADGRSPIFNGHDLKGWHFSRTTHHGTTGDARVEHGAIALRQKPYGQGGLLVTDKRYKNFDLYLEVLAPPGCNSGIFFRSTESGSAYQIELVDGPLKPTTAALIGERLRVSDPVEAPDLKDIWKSGQWNSMRIRVEGDSPRVSLWINGVHLWDVQETANNKVAGETDGHIGLQLHWSTTYQPELAGAGITGPWKPGAAIRFRNIALNELPAESKP